MKGIRFLFFYKWLYFNFISTKVSRCCFIEQHFIIFRKFPSLKSFLPCQNTKEAEELLYAISNLQIYLSLLYVGKGKNKTCRENLSTLIWLLCKVMIISLFLVPSYLVFCLKQIYFAGWSPRSKVICHGKRMFPYSPSAKTNQQKRLKEIGTCTTVQCIYHCYPI